MRPISDAFYLGFSFRSKAPGSSWFISHAGCISDLTEISFGDRFLILRTSDPFWALGVKSVFIAGAAY